MGEIRLNVNSVDEQEICKSEIFDKIKGLNINNNIIENEFVKSILNDSVFGFGSSRGEVVINSNENYIRINYEINKDNDISTGLVTLSSPSNDQLDIKKSTISEINNKYSICQYQTTVKPRIFKDQFEIIKKFNSSFKDIIQSEDKVVQYGSEEQIWIDNYGIENMYNLEKYKVEGTTLNVKDTDLKYDKQKMLELLNKDPLDFSFRKKEGSVNFCRDGHDLATTMIVDANGERKENLYKIIDQQQYLSPSFFVAIENSDIYPMTEQECIDDIDRNEKLSDNVKEGLKNKINVEKRNESINNYINNKENRKTL